MTEDEKHADPDGRPRRRANRRIFSYEEAQNTFPMVRGLTHAAVRQIEALHNSLHSREEMEYRRGEMEDAYERIVQAWADELISLGCEVKGLWLVDWDMGEGYYCWKYPEEVLGHYHDYDEGFAGRVPVQ